MGALPSPALPLRRAMDVLYRACAIIAGSALVLISLVVPWGVYTRYVLESAASWPEPMAILLSIVLTFFGAAVCYRAGVHMRVTVARDLLPPLLRRAVDLIAEGLMALVSIFGKTSLLQSTTVAGGIMSSTFGSMT